MVMAAHQTDILQQEVDKIKKANELEVAAYRAQHQQKTTRREYDLSDPDQIKNDVVPTVRRPAPCRFWNLGEARGGWHQFPVSSGHGPCILQGRLLCL